jgi:hypothetical protein
VLKREECRGLGSDPVRGKDFRDEWDGRREGRWDRIGRKEKNR